MKNMDGYRLYSVILYLSLFICATVGSDIFRRFEYKYSFKPPYLAQKDGSVPFWTYGGNAIASADNIRLVPSLKSQKGAIWSKVPTNFDWWEVDIIFRVTGRGRIGADGMAFWYVTQHGDFHGNVYGSSDRWVGLGVIFDSFDNDEKQNNPYIMAVINDGTKDFDHDNDGIQQKISGCLSDFRNKPYATRARIQYYRNRLTVLIHNGNTNTHEEKDYELCMNVDNVVLPRNGYFGVSAATGGLADDHDVKQFLTHSLYATDSQTQHVDPKPAEHTKLNQEYDTYQQKLDQQKHEYEKLHPEAKMNDPEENEDYYESVDQRELRQIFSVQNQMFDTIRGLSRKVDEVIGRQDKALSLISTRPAQGQVGPPASVDASHQQYLDQNLAQVMNTQRELYNAVMELRNTIVDVHRKTDSVLNNQVKQPVAQVEVIGSDSPASILNELKHSLNQIRHESSGTSRNVAALKQNSCPNTTCLSTVIFILVAIVQILSIVGYLIYKDRKESQAKKFY